jgi:light-regulated signal transduction histidine kinase (bacteriophytochrome)
MGAGIGLALARKQAEENITRRTEQLEVANRELESLNLSLSRDLRAPLGTIDGYLRIILREQEDSLGENTKRYFTMISDNLQNMRQRIDDLLSPSC